MIDFSAGKYKCRCNNVKITLNRMTFVVVHIQTFEVLVVESISDSTKHILKQLLTLQLLSGNMFIIIIFVELCY